MLYGRLLYGNNAYNEEILFAHGTVEGFASAAAVKVHAAVAAGVVECSAAVSSAALYARTATGAAVVSGLAGAVRVISVQAVISVGVSAWCGRTRVKYVSFGQAVAIRAAYNEGFRVASAGVLYPAQGSLEWVVQPYSVTSGALRYLFDGGGASGQNLSVVITTGGYVQVTCGTVTLTSTMPVAGDGAVWVGVGWDSSGVDLYLDGQLAASSTQQFTLNFGTNFYVGCSASQANSLDGLLDELRVSSRKRTAAEFSASCELGQLGYPLEWDVDTTYLMHFDGNLDVPATRQGVWVSPVLDATTAASYESLLVIWLADTPVNTAVACQVRTSSDGISWSPWYDQVNNEYSAAPPNPYAQVRFILQELNNAGTPILHEASIIYEGQPTAEVLKSGLSYSTYYSFAQLVDKMVICNGVDYPMKYDGTSVTTISSAPIGKVACTYRERIFMAKGSTLYFSEPTNVDSWPAANFIDVNPDDGDEIMALVPLSTTLLIVKRYSMYFLTGYGPQSFRVEPAATWGSISNRGVADTPYGVFEVDREGVWVTDFRKQEQVTLPIRELWSTINQRALDRTTVFYIRDKLLVAVPANNLSYNSMVLAYDLLHKAWSVWQGVYASCFTVFRERGKWVYLFGDSRTGNVWEISDTGDSFSAVIETKHYAPTSEGLEKRFLWIDLVFGGGDVDTEVIPSVVVDGQRVGMKSFTVPANVEREVYRLYPAAYGASVGVRLEMPSVCGGGPSLLEADIVYYLRASRPVRVV